MVHGEEREVDISDKEMVLVSFSHTTFLFYPGQPSENCGCSEVKRAENTKYKKPHWKQFDSLVS